MTVVLAGIDDEVLWLARSLGIPVGVVSDPHVQGTWCGFDILASDEAAIERSPSGVIICIDSPKAKQRIHRLYAAAGIGPVDVVGGQIHPTAVHGPGLVLQTGGLVSTNCRLGRCVKINIRATVMHDAAIGDFVTIAPGAVVLGRVTIGAGSFIGANATLLPDIAIGEDVVVGAGAVVTRDVPSGRTVKGVPAK